MNATDRLRILNNIVAQNGIEADLYAELAKAERMISAMDQGKMMPPPVPEIEQQPSQSQQPAMGKYDDL